MTIFWSAGMHPRFGLRRSRFQFCKTDNISGAMKVIPRQMKVAPPQTKAVMHHRTPKRDAR